MNSRAGRKKRLAGPGQNLNELNAELTWQELQGLTDRVRILKRVVLRLSESLESMQERARSSRGLSAKQRA